MLKPLLGRMFRKASDPIHYIGFAILGYSKQTPSKLPAHLTPKPHQNFEFGIKRSEYESCQKKWKKRSLKSIEILIGSILQMKFALSGLELIFAHSEPPISI